MDSQTTFILLGNTGAGKSSTGNTILGETVFVSKQSFEPVTVEISEQEGSILGKRISVIDTPGILGPDDEEDSQTEVAIKNHCDELLRKGRPCLFLVVVKIDRFTRMERQAVEAALRVIGKEQEKNSYLLFTGEDALINKTLEDFLNENPKSALQNFVKTFGVRYHIFNNKSREQNQVVELMKKSGLLKSATPSAQSATLKERRIILFGLPGAGKSSSGNTILGLHSQSDCFKSDCDFSSVTKNTVSKSAEVQGHWVTVVDTPGITGEGWDAKMLFKEIMKSIEVAAPGPHAFIFVVKLDRLTKANEKLFELLPKLFDRDAPKYSMVLFTHIDKLRSGNVAEKIHSSSSVRSLVEKCGGRYCEFDNTMRGNRLQVKELLVQINDMVRCNNEIHYTSDMFNKVHTLPVSLSIMWHDKRDWFEQFLKDLCKLFKCTESSDTVSLLSVNLMRT